MNCIELKTWAFLGTMQIRVNTFTPWSYPSKMSNAAFKQQCKDAVKTVHSLPHQWARSHDPLGGI